MSDVAAGPTPWHERVHFSSFEAGMNFRLVELEPDMWVLEASDALEILRYRVEGFAEAQAVMDRVVRRRLEHERRLEASRCVRKQDWSPRASESA